MSKIVKSLVDPLLEMNSKAIKVDIIQGSVVAFYLWFNLGSNTTNCLTIGTIFLIPKYCKLNQTEPFPSQYIVIMFPAVSSPDILGSASNLKPINFPMLSHPFDNCSLVKKWASLADSPSKPKISGRNFTSDENLLAETLEFVLSAFPIDRFKRPFSVNHFPNGPSPLLSMLCHHKSVEWHSNEYRLQPKRNAQI
ncbi:hypothetical protein BpHYR1_002768 [Brachionus plicatilis]|uniref:Uncharacterized protein n=1 Tax=Brachionus plicatilis TaxID=10195 RepID=A0A3M7SZI6_BRAPC|nr:hypothetical protein BpHYR1_002768 [Brachionus plicatilis]